MYTNGTHWFEKDRITTKNKFDIETKRLGSKISSNKKPKNTSIDSVWAKSICYNISKKLMKYNSPTVWVSKFI